MFKIKTVDKVSDIKLSSDWKDSDKFNSRGRIVGENGKPITSSYKGKQYRLISKKEHNFTFEERFGRGLLGIVAAVFTLCIAIHFESVRNLFTQEKEKIRFAVAVPKSSESENPEDDKSLSEDSPSEEELQEHEEGPQSGWDISEELKSIMIDILRDDGSDKYLSKDSISEEELQKSEEELQSGVDISEETISKIQTLMPDILKRYGIYGVKLYDSQPDHRVFSLDKIPGYIFKMNVSGGSRSAGQDDSMKARYQKMINAQTVCRTHGLGLLVIPNAKLFTVEFEGEKYEIIAEKKLDLNPIESVQEEYYEEYASSLDETIRQLATFICKTGYSDVEWRNNPVLNGAPDQLGRRKIGLIDLEEMDGVEKGLFGHRELRRGLIGCVTEEQGKIVEDVAKKYGVPTSSFVSDYARSKRKEEIEDGQKLKKHYAEHNIVTGFEPIDVDISTLGLDLTEKVQIMEGKVVNRKWEEKPRTITFEEVAKDTIEEINRAIWEAPVDATAKRKRCFLLSVNREPIKTYEYLPIPEDKRSIDEEDIKTIWLRRLVFALIEKGHLFKLNNVDAGGYYIQA